MSNLRRLTHASYGRYLATSTQLDSLQFNPRKIHPAAVRELDDNFSPSKSYQFSIWCDSGLMTLVTFPCFNPAGSPASTPVSTRA